MKMNRKHLAVGIALVGLLLLSSAIGYAKERRAEILVAWEPGAGALADRNPGFEDIFERLHMGNPFWFLKK